MTVRRLIVPVVVLVCALTLIAVGCDSDSEPSTGGGDDFQTTTLAPTNTSAPDLSDASTTTEVLIPSTIPETTTATASSTTTTKSGITLTEIRTATELSWGSVDEVLVYTLSGDWCAAWFTSPWKGSYINAFVVLRKEGAGWVAVDSASAMVMLDVEAGNYSWSVVPPDEVIEWIVDTYENGLVE